MVYHRFSALCTSQHALTDVVRMRQQPESRKSEGGPSDLKDYLRIWRRPQTWSFRHRAIQLWYHGKDMRISKSSDIVYLYPKNQMQICRNLIHIKDYKMNPKKTTAIEMEIRPIWILAFTAELFWFVIITRIYTVLKRSISIWDIIIVFIHWYYIMLLVCLNVIKCYIICHLLKY